MTKIQFDAKYAKILKNYDRLRRSLWSLIYQFQSEGSLTDDERRAMHGIQESMRCTLERFDDLLVRPVGKMTLKELSKKTRGW